MGIRSTGTYRKRYCSFAIFNIDLINDADGNIGKSDNCRGLCPLVLKVFVLTRKIGFFVQSLRLQFGYKCNSGFANIIVCLISLRQHILIITGRHFTVCFKKQNHLTKLIMLSILN